jgi:hypothetical protein
MGTTLSIDTNAAPRRAVRTIVRYLPAAARVAMGALFLFSGLFGLLTSPQPVPGLPEGAVAFSTALMKTGYMFKLVCGTEALVGALLLANRFVPLALALLAPVVVNIVAFHLFLEPGGLPVAVVVAVLETYLAWSYRAAFRPMLAARAVR